MINEDEKNQLLNTIEILTREHRAMSQTLASTVHKCTLQQNTIRAFRRLAPAAIDSGAWGTPENDAKVNELEALIRATGGGQLVD